jgi:uncharacterized protein YnzC (UPF0291/DUF896 family)
MPIDPDWINEIAEALLDVNINKLSEKQKNLLRELYLENLKNGMKPKESINNALQVVSCFKT